LLVDGSDPKQISDAILRILSDPELSESLSAYGLQLALDNNTEAVARQFLRTCERLLSEYIR
jgi:glycosyltransferase involved in cell wall biosynthesis